MKLSLSGHPQDVSASSGKDFVWLITLRGQVMHIFARDINCRMVPINMVVGGGKVVHHMG